MSEDETMTQTRPHTRVPKKASRPAGPPTPRPRPQPGVCTCRKLIDAHIDERGNVTGGHLTGGGRPLIIATFHDGDLVQVERIHWAGRDRCSLPTEHLDPSTWSRS